MKLLFTCDLDPLGVTIDEERNQLNWFDFMDLYKFRKCFSKYNWKMNWFIRADSFVEKFHNDIGWQYHNHISIWDDFREFGDGLAWHPHLYDHNGGSFELFKDDILEAELLETLFKKLKKIGINFEYVRVGEGRGSNHIIKILAENGIKADFSAIPGRYRKDENRNFDWLKTGNNLYYPSKKDYREQGDINHQILEVPLTTTLVNADYDDEAKLRYLDLSYRNDIFKESLEYLLDSENLSFLHFVCHPEGLISDDFSNGLYDYGIKTLSLNLDVTHKLLNDKKIEFESLNLEGFYNYFKNDERRHPVY